MKSLSHFPVAGLSLAVTSALLVAPWAAAQEDQAAWLEEVVVTAQNREQAITDVPISMNVLNGKALEDAGITDVRNLGRLAPDFNTTNDGESTRLTLRGISTESNDEGVDQALTVNIDGEYINRPRLLNAVMFDLERVEVLRGPQGTLYGRNATGGALNIIAKKPVLGEFTGSVSVDVGDYDARALNAAVNVPLGETAAMRLAVMSSEHDGYFDHDNVGMESGGEDTQAARLGLLFEPTERLSIYVAAETSESEPDAPLAAVFSDNVSGQSGEGTGSCNTAAGWEEIFNGNGTILCSPQSTNNLSSIDESDYDGPITSSMGSHEIEGDAIRTQIEYEFDAMTLTYRGGYRDAEMHGVFPLQPNYLFYRNEEAKTQSHELRLSGGEDRFFWQGGVFYTQEKLNVYSGLLAFIGAYPNGPQGFWPNTFYRPDMKSESKAAFGQVDIPIGETLTAVVGARYTQDEKGGSYTNLPGGLTFEEVPSLRPIDTAGATTTQVDFDNNEFTWSVGLNWEPEADQLYYAKISKGYKAGGFDAPGNAFDPETVTAWEIGVKNSYDTWSVNGSAFYYDYKDLQVSVLLDTNKGGEIFNAGAATIWGFEGAFDFYLTGSDRLSVSLNYLEAEYDEFVTSKVGQDITNGGFDNSSSGPLGRLFDLKGNKLPHAPKLILTLGYDHVWQLDGGSLTASLYTRWKDDYFMSPFNYNDGHQDSYTQTDISLKFETSDRRWDVQLYARNLEDEQPMTYHGFTVAGADDVQVWYFGSPRTYGAKVAYNF